MLAGKWVQPSVLPGFGLTLGFMVKSIRYRGWIYRTSLGLFVISFFVLGWLGLQPAEGVYVNLARIFSVVYFAFFLLMPYYTTIDKTKPVPERVVYHA